MKPLTLKLLIFLSIISVGLGAASVTHAVLVAFDFEIDGWSVEGSPPYDTGIVTGTFSGSSQSSGSGIPCIELAGLTFFEARVVGSNIMPDYAWSLSDLVHFHLPISQDPDWGFEAMNSDGVGIIKGSVGFAGVIRDPSRGSDSEFVARLSKVVLVPEPTTVTLIAIGCLVIVCRRRK